MCETASLPFLADALRRHLEQFPWVGNGLSRTERQIPEVADSGVEQRAFIFQAVQQMENPVFMGDAALWLHLNRLAGGRSPLVQVEGGRATITAKGREVLRGREDAVRLNGIDRWLGGVHLQGAEAAWRWDAAAQRLLRAS